MDSGRVQLLCAAWLSALVIFAKQAHAGCFGWRTHRPHHASQNHTRRNHAGVVVGWVSLLGECDWPLAQQRFELNQHFGVGVVDKVEGCLAPLVVDPGNYLALIDVNDFEASRLELCVVGLNEIVEVLCLR